LTVKKSAPPKRAPKKRTENSDNPKPQVNRTTSAPAPVSGESENDLSSQDNREEPVKTYAPRRLPLEHADFDQHAAEEQRQRELAAAREEHNRRTGDASRR
jgi:hypothetical protein